MAAKLGSAGEVICAHVMAVPQPYLVIPGIGAGEIDLAPLEEAYAKNGARILEEAAEQIRAAGCQRVKVRLESGNPKHRLLQLAQDEGCDLIVLGSRGTSDLGAIFLGSVADYICHHSTIPVLLARCRECQM
jgi:nucleotide-binding universal stress UspA family protein